MKLKVLFISFFCLITLCAYTQKKVAVYVTGDDPINDIVASRLVDGLARNGKYKAVERTASFLNALSKEHSYERDGNVDDNEIALLGKQFSVQYVCVASVIDVWRNEKYITARIIEVESAKVVASSSSNGSIKSSSDLISAMNTLSDNFLKALDFNKNSGAQKVAVYVTKTGNRDVDVILGDQLVSGFTLSGKYIAVERTNSFLSQISKEQGYQYSGAVDDDDLTRLGKQFGVQYVCVAKTTSWAGDYFISTRLIDVATGEVVNSYNAEGVQLSNSQSVVAVASEISTRLSGLTIKEEKEFQEAEARRIAKEEADRKQALIDRPWRDLLKKVTTNVTKILTQSCYIGSNYRLWVWNNNGQIYCGWVENGDFDSYGGSMYIASEGHDLYNCPGGWAFVGEFTKDKMRDGTIYDHDGNIIYNGKFLFDKPKDKCPNSYSSLSSYKFKVVNYNNGDKYIGELYNGDRHGYGLYIWESGDAWYGKWTNGQRNGHGMYMNYDGSYSKGKWENNNKVE